MEKPFLASAMSLAQRGGRVFALGVRQKIPRKGSNGVKDATSDPSQIRRMWSIYENANIGLACGDPENGGSGIWVLDFDAPKPKDSAEKVSGLEVRKQLELDHGALGGITARTGNGVQHIFRWSEGLPKQTAGMGHGRNLLVDIRSTGGYTLAPPSVHPVGRPYVWSDDDEEPFNELDDPPAWLVEWVTARLAEATGDAQGSTGGDLPFDGPDRSPSGLTAPQATQQASESGRRERTPQMVAEVRSMLGYISGESFDLWRDVGFAIHELGWGRAGFDLWDAWSRGWPAKYDAAAQESHWASFSRGYTGKKVTFASVVRWAEQGGWGGGAASSVAIHGTESDNAPLAFFDRERAVGPAIAVEDVFGAAPRFAEYLYAASEYLQVPESSVALAHLAGVSSVVSKRIAIDNGVFSQPPVIWFLSLMQSGARKSEIVDLVREPIMGIANSVEARARRAEAVERHSKLNDKLRAELEKSTPDPKVIRSIEQQLADNRSGGLFNLGEMVLSDTTEAGLQEALYQTHGAAFVCDGEAAALNNAISPAWAQKTGAVPQVTTWLNAYSGKSINVKRANKQRLQGVISRPELAVCLIVQAGHPTDYLFQHPHLRDSGFMGRFLIDVPHFNPEDVSVDVRRPRGNWTAAWKRFASEYLLSERPKKPRVIEFDYAAQETFLGWRRKHQREFAPGGANNDLVEFHNKAQGTMTRIAGLLACVRAFEVVEINSGWMVEEEDVERALALFPKFVAHIRAAFFGRSYDPGDIRVALRALKIIESKLSEAAFSWRDVYRRSRRVPKESSALEILVENRWIVPTNERHWQARDQRTKFLVNPLADLSTVPAP